MKKSLPSRRRECQLSLQVRDDKEKNNNNSIILQLLQRLFHLLQNSLYKLDLHLDQKKMKMSKSSSNAPW